LSDIRCRAEIEEKDDDGNPTYFTDVAKFWKDPYNGKYMKKFCEVKILHWYNEDESIQLGSTEFLNLAPFIGKKNEEVVLYFQPDNSDLRLVLIEADITIRPSTSKETTKPRHTVSEQGPIEETIKPQIIGFRSDPELK
jgi:hypothetical protein